MKQKIKITREEIEKVVGAKIFVKGAWSSYCEANKIHTEQVFRDFPDIIEIEVDALEENQSTIKKLLDNFRKDIFNLYTDLKKRVEKLEAVSKPRDSEVICINGNPNNINCGDVKCQAHFAYLRGRHE